MYALTYALQTLLWPGTRAFFDIVFKLKIKGAENLENLDRSRGVILVANHDHDLDAPLIAAVLPFFSSLRPLYFVSRTKNLYRAQWYWFIAGGWLFKIFGAYAAPKGLNDYRLAFQNHLRLLADGKTVLIFPEGGTPATRKPGNPRPGIKYLAEYSGSVLVPIAISSRTMRHKVIIGRPFLHNGESAEEIFRHVELLKNEL